MNRTEFLDTLRSQLSGQMHEGKVAAHVRYYEDYIQSQVRSGRDEQQVLDELGDPAGIMYMYGGLIPGTANFWAW